MPILVLGNIEPAIWISAYYIQYKGAVSQHTKNLDTLEETIST